MAGIAGPVAPPQNLEAEQSVLGAVLLSDTALPALIIDERLRPGDFYREAHGRIYEAISGGQSAEARKAMRTHLTRSLQRYRRLAERHSVQHLPPSS